MWLDYIQNSLNRTLSTFRCKQCHSFANSQRYGQKIIPALSAEEGYFKPHLKKMYTPINDHTKSAMKQQGILQAKFNYVFNLKLCHGAISSKKETILTE